jgi:hypothetical protein
MYVQQLFCSQWRASCRIYNSYFVVSGVHHVVCTTVMLRPVACMTSNVDLFSGQWRAWRHMYNGYAVASGVHNVICTAVMLLSVACIMSYVQQLR